ncbi:MAG: hypothetical protein ACRDD7_08410 [Peptostreptococcaceae bacterium]
MDNYAVLRDRIQNIFSGFYLEEDEDCPYVDIDKIDREIVDNRLFGIDSFPKQMEVNSPHGVLDVFYDLEKDKSRYFLQEDKFFRALLLIMSYSKDIIIGNGYFLDENKKQVEKCLVKKEREYLKVIKDTLFDFKDIEFDYYAISSLLKLTLRERSSLAIYMMDLEVALDIQGLYSNVYLGKNGDIDMVRNICNVEGLYIRNT